MTVSLKTVALILVFAYFAIASEVTVFTTDSGLASNSICQVCAGEQGIMIRYCDAWTGFYNGSKWRNDDSATAGHKGQILLDICPSPKGFWCRYTKNTNAAGMGYFNGEIWKTFDTTNGMLDNDFSFSGFRPCSSGVYILYGDHSSWKNTFGLFDGLHWRNIKFEDADNRSCYVNAFEDFNVLGGNRIISLTSGCENGPLIYNGASPWDNVNATVPAKKLYMGALGGTFWTQNDYQISSGYVSYFNGVTMNTYGTQDSVLYCPSKIIPDSTGTWLTFSSNYAGVILTRFDGAKFKNFYSINGRTAPVSDVVPLPGGRALALWHGNQPGISLYDNGSWEDIFQRVGFSGNVSVTHDVVWFAQTDKGVARWNLTTDSVVFFNKANGSLPSDSIVHSCIDKNGNFWFSPKIALVRIARNSYSTNTILNKSPVASIKQFNIVGNELRYTVPFSSKIAIPTLLIYTLSGRQILSTNMLKITNTDWIFKGLNSISTGMYIAKIISICDSKQAVRFLLCK